MTVQVRLRSVDVMRLAAESARDPRTVRLVLQGKGSELSRCGVIEAAKRLGLPLPPEASDASSTTERASLNVRAT